MKKKLLTSFALLFVSFTLFAGIASAHVTVLPKEATQGSYEMFTVRVPSENETVTTTQIKVEIPAEINISRFEPKPGWKYEIQKDAAGKITSVTWTAEGQGLSSTEFGLFNMQGKVADDATEIVWKAYQTYQDGTVVEWVGAPNAEKPASVTTVKVSDGTDDHHGAATADESKEEPKTEQADEAVKNTASSSNTPLYVSIAALIAGLLALGVSLKKR